MEWGGVRVRVVVLLLLLEWEEGGVVTEIVRTGKEGGPDRKCMSNCVVQCPTFAHIFIQNKSSLRIFGTSRLRLP